MGNDVRTEHAEPRTLAAIHTDTPQAQLGSEISRVLDRVWASVREQGVRTGHNVFVYWANDGGVLSVDIGVQVFTDFDDRDDVRTVSTPGGEVATVAHFGDYGEMASSYDALFRWCAEHDRATGPSWEVYGDWSDDPAQCRTDLYVLLRDPS